MSTPFLVLSRRTIHVIIIFIYLQGNRKYSVTMESHMAPLILYRLMVIYQLL